MALTVSRPKYASRASFRESAVAGSSCFLRPPDRSRLRPRRPPRRPPRLRSIQRGEARGNPHNNSTRSQRFDNSARAQKRGHTTTTATPPTTHDAQHRAILHSTTQHSPCHKRRTTDDQTLTPHHDHVGCAHGHGHDPCPHHGPGSGLGSGCHSTPTHGPSSGDSWGQRSVERSRVASLQGTCKPTPRQHSRAHHTKEVR